MPKWSKRLLATPLRYANNGTVSTKKEARLLVRLRADRKATPRHPNVLSTSDGCGAKTTMQKDREGVILLTVI